MGLISINNKRKTIHYSIIAIFAPHCNALTHFSSVAVHTETSHLFLTGFYMKRNSRMKWVKPFHTNAPFLYPLKTFPAGIYLLKVNKRNSRIRCEICSKLTIKTSEGRHWRRSDVFIVDFEHMAHFALVFVLLTLNM